MLAFDPFLPDEAIADAGAEPGDLAHCWRAPTSCRCAPLTPDTHHMIGTAELGSMRPGAVIVNTSRGGLVDLDAVREALSGGTLGGVALDVMEQEPPDPDDPLLTHPA